MHKIVIKMCHMTVQTEVVHQTGQAGVVWIERVVGVVRVHFFIWNTMAAESGSWSDTSGW
jgi:hypothetical protein